MGGCPRRGPRRPGVGPRGRSPDGDDLGAPARPGDVRGAQLRRSWGDGHRPVRDGPGGSSLAHGARLQPRPRAHRGRIPGGAERGGGGSGTTRRAGATCASERRGSADRRAAGRGPLLHAVRGPAGAGADHRCFGDPGRGEHRSEATVRLLRHRG